MASSVLHFLRIAWKAFCYSLGTLALVLAAVQAWFYVQVLWWGAHNPATTSFMQARLERLRERDPKASLRHQWVGYARISVHLKRAVIAAEDAKFVGHEGFD